jgi:hypothetical protein
VLLSGTAQADLPPVGAEVLFTMHAAAVPLKLDSLGSLTIGFEGGIDILVRGAGAPGSRCRSSGSG